MANRTRNIVLRVPVTPEERALIQQKMAQLHTKNFSAYARKMLIDGYIVHMDTSDIRAQTAELQKIGVNVNQIARRINSTGTVYAQDIEDIKGALAKIWQLQRYILSSQTLKKALDYIENPDKTEDKMLVSSFGCCYETADIEFEMLLAQAIQKGNNLAHHLIQSFAPGEATPEQAHEIGKLLADEVLQGKYSYVLTTHIDKGHVHNHLIFCAVDMVNHRKYNSNRQSYAYIRRTSDRLCREHGLTVVQPSRDKGKSYAEWDAGRKGKSWKAKLKAAIDAVIPQAKTLTIFSGSWRRRAMRSSRANLSRSAPPDRNASPAARRWVRTIPRKPSPAGSKGWPWTEARTGSARVSHCGSTWRTTSRPSRARVMHVGRSSKI